MIGMILPKLTSNLTLSAALLATAIVIAAFPVNRVSMNKIDVDLAPLPSLTEPKQSVAPKTQEIIIERPLFSPGRRPAASGSSEEVVLGNYRLAGTLSNNRVQKALFVLTVPVGSPGAGKWLAVDDSLGEWRILSIESGRVVLTRGAETTTLSLSHARALSPKEASQLRAATPIRRSGGARESAAVVEARRAALKALFEKEGDSGDQN